MFWILVFLFTVIPVGLIIKLIYDLNEHEKQPLWMLGLMFFGGCLTFVLVRMTSNFLNGRVYELQYDSGFLGNNWEFFLISFGLIAIVEELSKFLIVNVLGFRSKYFKYPYDGIVYAVIVSLGFAFIENFKYLGEQGLGIAISRAIFTIPAHAAFGVIMGYYLALAKACKLKKLQTDSLKMRYIALFSPLLLHGAYDYICNFNNRIAYYILIAYTFMLYILAFYKIHKFNELDILINKKANEVLSYQKDDIVLDYKDDLMIRSDDIQEKLFQNDNQEAIDVQNQASWNTNGVDIQSKGVNLKMFANEEEQNSNRE